MFDRVSNSPEDLLANAIFSKNSTGLWLISGPSGSGKTTWCAKIITQARALGMTVGGFICPAVIQNGKKIGIDLMNVASGEKRHLGIRSSDTSKNTIGGWQMDESVLTWGNEIIAALKDEDILIIDEIGPLELEKGLGYWQALQLLDEGRYRTALVVVRPALLPLAQKRWPLAKVLNLECVNA
jgi:nucleoside-triphosphatase THEP1